MLVRRLAIWKQIANSAHSSVSGFLFNIYSCWQRRYEQIWKFGAMSILIPECCFVMAQWTLRNIGNGAMNTPRCWQLHDDAWQSKKLYWSSIFLSTFFSYLSHSLSSLCVACNTERSKHCFVYQSNTNLVPLLTMVLWISSPRWHFFSK